MKQNRITNRLIKKAKMLAGREDVDFLNNMLQQMASAQKAADDAYDKMVELHDSNVFADDPFKGVLNFGTAEDVTDNFTMPISTKVIGTYEYGGADEILAGMEQLADLTEDFLNKLEKLYVTWTNLSKQAEAKGLYDKFTPIDE